MESNFMSSIFGEIKIDKFSEYNFFTFSDRIKTAFQFNHVIFVKDGKVFTQNIKEFKVNSLIGLFNASILNVNWTLGKTF